MRDPSTPGCVVWQCLAGCVTMSCRWGAGQWGGLETTGLCWDSLLGLQCDTQKKKCSIIFSDKRFQVWDLINIQKSTQKTLVNSAEYQCHQVKTQSPTSSGTLLWFYFEQYRCKCTQIAFLFGSDLPNHFWRCWWTQWPHWTTSTNANVCSIYIQQVWGYQYLKQGDSKTWHRMKKVVKQRGRQQLDQLVTTRKLDNMVDSWRLASKDFSFGLLQQDVTPLGTAERSTIR